MIYHHYRSKTDLFFAVYRHGMEINTRAVLPHVQADLSARERLSGMAFAHAVTMMAEQPFQRTLLEGVNMHQSSATTAAQRDMLSSLIETRDRYQALFRETIEALQREESLDIGDPSLAVMAFLAVLNSSVIWYTPRNEEAGDEQSQLAQTLVTYAMRGLGTDPAPFEGGTDS